MTKVVEFNTVERAISRVKASGGFVLVHRSGREFFYCPDWNSAVALLADYSGSVEGAEAWLMRQPVDQLRPIQMAPYIAIVAGGK